MQIKAVCFDLGGVLIQNATHVFYQRTVARLGLSLDKVTGSFEQFRPKLERGEITNEEFWQSLCEDLKVQFTPDMLTLWSEKFIEETPPIPGVLDLADKVKAAGYKIGLLSNTTKQHVAINRTRHISCSSRTLRST